MCVCVCGSVSSQRCSTYLRPSTLNNHPTFRSFPSFPSFPPAPTTTHLLHCHVPRAYAQMIDFLSSFIYFGYLLLTCYAFAVMTAAVPSVSSSLPLSLSPSLPLVILPYTQPSHAWGDLQVAFTSCLLFIIKIYGSVKID